VAKQNFEWDRRRSRCHFSYEHKREAYGIIATFVAGLLLSASDIMHNGDMRVELD